jgi:hypothetical protein
LDVKADKKGGHKAEFHFGRKGRQKKLGTPLSLQEKVANKIVKFGLLTPTLSVGLNNLGGPLLSALIPLTFSLALITLVLYNYPGRDGPWQG